MNRKPKKRITEYSIKERFRNLNRALKYYHKQEQAFRKLKVYEWEYVEASFWLIRRQAILDARIKQLRKDEKKMLIDELHKPFGQRDLLVYLTKKSRRLHTKFRSQKV